MSTEPDVIDVPLHLTQELIGQNTPDDFPGCLVARSFSVACPGASEVEVGCLYLSFFADGRRHVAKLPWEVIAVIDAFDNGFVVEPRTLTIPIPRSIAALPGFLADETLLSPRAVEAMPL